MVADLKGDLNLNFGHAATLGIGFAFLLAHMCGFYCIAVCFQHRQHEEARQVRGDEKKEAAEQRAADEKENDKLREEARRVRVQETEDATEQRAADERENDKLRDERRLIRVQEKEEAAMRRAADEKHNDKLVAALQKMNDALIAANKTASDALSDALVSAIHQAGAAAETAVEKHVVALKEELKAINAKITSPLASRSNASANVLPYRRDQLGHTEVKDEVSSRPGR